MNQTITSIMNRRSTRVFEEGNVQEADLQAIIEAGLHAPSAHNQQTWHLTVIEKREMLDYLNEEAKAVARNMTDEFTNKMGHNEKFHIFYNAPIAVIVSGEELGIMPEADCAAASQNMLIAAESLGLGSCWVGLVVLALNGPNALKIREDLGIPEGYKPYYALIFGNKKESQAKARPRREGTVSYIK